LRTFVPEACWPRQIDVDGVTIKIRHTPYSFATRLILKRGEYEKHERALLGQIMRPGMQVLELGSSIGILASVIAHRMGPSGRLVTVEASPTLTNYSKTWLGKPGHVDIVTGYAFPVWESPGGLHVDGFKEGASLGGTVTFSVDGGNGQAAPAQTGPRVYDLSTLCREYSLRPELLVVDVEGSEAVMLRQKPNLPDWIRYVLIELHPGLYPNKEKDQSAIVEVLRKEGMRLAQRVDTAWLFERIEAPRE